MGHWSALRKVVPSLNGSLSLQACCIPLGSAPNAGGLCGYAVQQVPLSVDHTDSGVYQRLILVTEVQHMLGDL